MRVLSACAVVFTACGGADEINHEPADNTPSTIIFETATHTAGTQQLLPAREASGDGFVGVRFTTARPYVVTGLGARIYSTSPDTPVLIAVVPLDPTTELPKTTTLTDRIGFGVGAMPVGATDEELGDTVIETRFTLPAGTWGLVVASDRLGVRYTSGHLPFDVVAVGTPEYIHYAEDGGVEGYPGQWFNTDEPDDIRLFVRGH
jgi:hypothetical protein